MKPEYTSDIPSKLEVCEKQLEVCKNVIREISWQAQRYANGRSTYAPCMFNSAIKMLDENGLGDLHKPDTIGDKSRFAKEG
jgi:hypothetical protein